MPNDFATVESVRVAVLEYFRNTYGRTDVSWHPLYIAVRDLWTDAFNEHNARIVR